MPENCQTHHSKNLVHAMDTNYPVQCSQPQFTYIMDIIYPAQCSQPQPSIMQQHIPYTTYVNQNCTMNIETACLLTNNIDSETERLIADIETKEYTLARTRQTIRI